MCVSFFIKILLYDEGGGGDGLEKDEGKRKKTNGEIKKYINKYHMGGCGGFSAYANFLGES